MGYLQDYVSSICDGHSKSPENLKAAATGGKFKAKRADNGVDKWFKGFAGGGVDRFFKVSERNSNFTTEVRAGFTTFLTAAYISALHGSNHAQNQNPTRARASGSGREPEHPVRHRPQL